MAATRRQEPNAQARPQPVAEADAGSGVVGPQAFVHLWLVLMIVAAVGVLLYSIPGPVYAAGLATIDPALGGLLGPAT